MSDINFCLSSSFLTAGRSARHYCENPPSVFLSVSYTQNDASFTPKRSHFSIHSTVTIVAYKPTHPDVNVTSAEAQILMTDRSLMASAATARAAATVAPPPPIAPEQQQPAKHSIHEKLAKKPSKVGALIF